MNRKLSNIIYVKISYLFETIQIETSVLKLAVSYTAVFMAGIIIRELMVK